MQNTSLPDKFGGKNICAAVLLITAVSLFIAAGPQSYRDRLHQPERVMDSVGVELGMTIGEVGAGAGYFTFHLARRVGSGGKIYANDISSSALRRLRNQAEREGFSNIETIVGEVADPLLPMDLDMVFIVNAFHDLSRPVEMLNNLAVCLKPHGCVVILDRDPGKFNDRSHHFYTRGELEEKIRRSRFELDRVETFLLQHNLYILRLPKTGEGLINNVPKEGKDEA